uniref:Uncharacterized protein n=1 Tax=Lepeophtheirus salmonis TaxID=72036 RepID=A0A0K2T8E4_LEPSM
MVGASSLSFSKSIDSAFSISLFCTLLLDTSMVGLVTISESSISSSLFSSTTSFSAPGQAGRLHDFSSLKSPSQEPPFLDGKITTLALDLVEGPHVAEHLDQRVHGLSKQFSGNSESSEGRLLGVVVVVKLSSTQFLSSPSKYNPGGHMHL